MSHFHWHHSPIHLLDKDGVFMVTAGTYLKEHHFKAAGRLDLLQDRLLELAYKYQWQLQAWAVFSNHYHFIGKSPADAHSLVNFIQTLHSCTAKVGK